MRLKVFTLKFSDASNGFDDAPIQDFLADKEVVETVNHFFIHEKTPYLTLIVSYRDVAVDERRKTAAPGRPERKDHREDLDEPEKKAYDALRVWRVVRAKQDGVPPYIVATNGQLAKFVRVRADSKTALMKADGFGEVKAEQYGAEILGVIADAFQTTAKEAIDAAGEKTP